MDEGEPISLQLLQDEPLAAEQPGAQLALERDADRHALGGAQERVLLAQDPVVVGGEIERNDAARIGRREGHVSATPAAVSEHGHEQGLARQHPLAGGEQLVHEAATPTLGAVAEDRVHLDAGIHVHERAGLRDAGLAGIEGDLDELHLLAHDHVVDLVSHAPGRPRDRTPEGGSEPGLADHGGPVAQAFPIHVRAAGYGAGTDLLRDLVGQKGPLLLAGGGQVPDAVAHSSQLRGGRGSRVRG